MTYTLQFSAPLLLVLGSLSCLMSQGSEYNLVTPVRVCGPREISRCWVVFLVVKQEKGAPELVQMILETVYVGGCYHFIWQVIPGVRKSCGE